MNYFITLLDYIILLLGPTIFLPSINQTLVMTSLKWAQSLASQKKSRRVIKLFIKLELGLLYPLR